MKFAYVLEDFLSYIYCNVMSGYVVCENVLGPSQPIRVMST